MQGKNIKIQIIFKPARRVNEDYFPVSFEACEDSIVELGVLANPRVAVVDVGGSDVLVRDVRQNDKPLLKKLGSESKQNVDENSRNNCFQRASKIDW